MSDNTVETWTAPCAGGPTEPPWPPGEDGGLPMTTPIPVFPSTLALAVATLGSIGGAFVVLRRRKD